MGNCNFKTEKDNSELVNELKLLSQVKSAFIVNMHYAFQDRENLYLVMDLLLGGDLRYHIARQRRFTEEQTKFFIACLVQALETVHGCGIIHRDIKPENLVFESDGYLRLTDFGIARYWSPDNASETSGTPGYMAPEVMCRQNHGVPSDYFAVGVIAYEFMNVSRPYIGKSRREIRENIIQFQVKIGDDDIPPGWSKEAADFINQCLQRKPSRRLGLQGNSEVKKHAWFDGFDWESFTHKKMTASYTPRQQDNFDKNYVNNPEWKDGSIVEEHAKDLDRQSVQLQFRGYYYDKDRPRRTTPFQSGLQSLMLETAQKQAIDEEEDDNKGIFGNGKSVDAMIKELNEEMGADGEDTKPIQEESYGIDGNASKSIESQNFGQEPLSQARLLVPRQ